MAYNKRDEANAHRTKESETKTMAKKPNADVQFILDELAKDSNPGNVQYLKDGDTVIKLVLPEGRTLRQFFERFETTFESKKEKGKMEITGDRGIASTMQTWLGLSPFAVEPKRVAA